MIKTKLRVLSAIFVCIFLIGVVTPMTIDFYHSEICPYCQEIYPTVEQHQLNYKDYNFNFLDVNNVYEMNWKKLQNRGIEAVPTFIINTDDNREIVFSGANEKKLNCELQQMSTKECPTYSAATSVESSWFVE